MAGVGDTGLSGWGPDFTEIEATCPKPGCWWKQVWTEPTTLAEVTCLIQAHWDTHEPPGEFLVRLESEIEKLTVLDGSRPPWPKFVAVVDRADRIVRASPEVVKLCADWITDDVLTVGTEGLGIGVVKYHIGPLGGPVPHHILTRLDTWHDRDR